MIIKIKSPKIEFELDEPKGILGNYIDSNYSNIKFLDFIKELIRKVSDETERLKDVW